MVYKLQRLPLVKMYNTTQGMIHVYRAGTQLQWGEISLFLRLEKALFTVAGYGNVSFAVAVISTTDRYGHLNLSIARVLYCLRFEDAVLAVGDDGHFILSIACVLYCLRLLRRFVDSFGKYSEIVRVICIKNGYRRTVHKIFDTRLLLQLALLRIMMRHLFALLLVLLLVLLPLDCSSLTLFYASLQEIMRVALLQPLFFYLQRQLGELCRSPCVFRSGSDTRVKDLVQKVVLKYVLRIHPLLDFEKFLELGEAFLDGGRFQKVKFSPVRSPPVFHSDRVEGVEESDPVFFLSLPAVLELDEIDQCHGHRQETANSRRRR